MQTKYRYWLYLSFFTFFLSLLFIRIYDKNIFTLPQTGDDSGYHAYTEALLRNHSLDWCKKPVYDLDLAKCHTRQGETIERSAYNKYTIGSSLILLPFTSFGYLLHELSIFKPQGIDVLLFWAVLGKLFIFLLTLILFFEIAILLMKSERIAFYSTLFFAIGNPVLYYVFRRPLMAHSEEIFLSVLFLFLAYKCWLNFDRKQTHWPILLGFFVGTLFITRINDAFMVAIGAAILFFGKNPKGRFTTLLYYGIGLLPPILLFCYTQYVQVGSLMMPTEKYDYATASINFLEIHFFNFRRILDFFIGSHWGLFWLMPILFLEASAIFSARNYWTSTFKKHKALFISIFIICFFQLNFLANYPTNSMSYANRYIIIFTSFIQVLFLFSLRECPSLMNFSKLKKIVAAVLLILGSLNVMNFESNQTTLTLLVGRLGDEGIYDPRFRERQVYVAPNYAFHSLKTSLTGKALLNIAVSPLMAYSYYSLKSLNIKVPAESKLVEYYSTKRNIYGFSDLKVLIQYHLTLLVFLLFSVILYFKFAKQKKSLEL